MIEEIRDDATLDGSEGLLAILLVKDSAPVPPGVNFITDRQADMQVATIKHPCGKEIQAHTHPPAKRTLLKTQEVLIMQRGWMVVRFYNSKGGFITSRSLREGDVVILIGGGHGFYCETDVEFVEVKTGPYLGDADKVRFQN